MRVASSQAATPHSSARKAARALHVSAADLPNLPLSDHRHCLEARQCSSRRPEAAIAEPRTGQVFDTSVVLLQNVVQVFHLA